MPTIVTNSIGTASRTYSTLQAWEDACPANLVTADQVWKGECYNDSEFSGSNVVLLAVGGMTTDATRYLWLTTASGQSFADHANKLTNAQRYDQTKGVGIRITGNYSQLLTAASSSRIIIEKLQFYYDSASTSNYYRGVQVNGSGYMALRQCILQTRQTGTSSGSLVAYVQEIVNCLLIAKSTGPGNLYISDNATLRDSTIVKVSDAASSSSNGIARGFTPNSVTVVNVGIFGFTSGTTIGSDALNASSSRIYTDATTLPGGTNNSTSLTYSSQFENTTNAASDFRTKAGSNFIGNATRDNAYTFDLDIVGQSRSLTTPTIGAWEVVSSIIPTLSAATAVSIGSTTATPRVTLTF